MIEPPIADLRDAEGDGRSRRPMRQLLADRNYRRLAIGQTLTQFGDFAMLIVLGIWVKTLTGSSAMAGLVFLALGLPSLASPLFGVLIDRFPRRRVMIVNDLVSAAVVLCLLFVRGRDDVWLIFAVAVAYGISTVVTFAARAGLLVSMLPEDLLGDANGLLASAGQGVRIAAPLLGAAMFAALGGPALAVFDAGTFLASAWLLSLVRSPDLEPAAARSAFLDELTAGVRHVWVTPELRRVVTVICVVAATIGMTEVAFYEVIDAGLHRPPSFLGVLAAIQGIGAIAGGLTAGAAMRRIGESRLAAAGLCAFAAGFGLVAVGRLWPVAVGAVIAGIGNAYFAVGYETLLQRRTAPELQGRVFGAAEAVIALPWTLSIAAGAAAVAAVGFRPLYIVGCVTLIWGAVALARPPSRREQAVEPAGDPYAAEDSISGA